MPDVLIRNLPAEDLDRLDEQARRLGLSRAELLRRLVQAEARRVDVAVSADHLVVLGDLVSDLADETVMTDAWS